MENADDPNNLCNLNKEATRFLKRKLVKSLLDKKLLTSYHCDRLNKLFAKFTCKGLENMHRTIACFVLYDLNNYEGRLRRLAGIPGTTRYTQLLRYGKHMADKVVAEQSHKKIKHLKNRVEYWLDNGHTNEEAKQLVSEYQKANSLKSPVTKGGTSIYTARSLTYWKHRGYTDEEAKDRVTAIQGREHTTERNIRWQTTLKSKSPNEIKLINLKKGHGIESYIARGFSYDEALALSNKYWSARRNYSASSQIFFNLLSVKLPGETFFKTNNYEKQFCGKHVDFYHSASGVVVEFYGDFWHRNPIVYNKDLVCYGMSSAEIWERDEARISMIQTHPDVSRVIIVWESDVSKNTVGTVDKTVMEILNVINSRN